MTQHIQKLRPVSKQQKNRLLPTTSSTGSTTVIQRAKIDQLQYCLPKQIIQEGLDRIGVRRQTEIWIYPNYPEGFTAVVGAHDEYVYIFEVEKSRIISKEITRCLGVRPNGSLIYTPGPI